MSVFNTTIDPLPAGVTPERTALNGAAETAATSTGSYRLFRGKTISIATRARIQAVYAAREKRLEKERSRWVLGLFRLSN